MTYDNEDNCNDDTYKWPMHINHKIHRPVVSVNIIKVVMHFRGVVIICTLLNIKHFTKSCSLSTACISVLLGTS